MLPAWTSLDGFFATCRHNGALAIATMDGWRVLRGRDRIASGTETGADARAAALSVMTRSA